MQNTPQLAGSLHINSSSVSSENTAMMSEQALTQAFKIRRNRMEAASRLTDTMLEQINSVVASDENNVHLMMFDNMVSPKLTGDVQDATEMAEQLKLGDDSVLLDTVAMSTSSDAFLCDEINQKLRRLCDMRIEQRNAADLQIKPTFQATDPEMMLFAPPEKFTSTSFAFALEAFAESVSRLVSASDRILVELALLEGSKTPHVFKEIKLLSLHSKHASRCYAAVLQHLKQYELCRKATQDAVAQELASMRENFLMRKEMLTTQEQKQKVAEEHFLALRHRLGNIETLCRMWLAVLQDVNAQIPFALSSMLVPPKHTSPLGGRDSLLSLRSFSVPRGSLARRTSFTESSMMSPARLSMRAQTPLLNEDVNMSEASQGSDDEAGASLDLMEAKVSRFWTNPYVMKAQQCSERLHRRQCMSNERVSMTAEPICFSNVSTNDAGQGITTAARFVADAARVSRCGSIYKPPNAADITEKAAAETRLVSLMRDLLRIVLGVAKRGEGFSPFFLKGEGTDVVEQGSEKNSIFTEGSIGDSRVLAPTIVAFETETDEATNAMLESTRNLIKFLEDGRASPT